MFIDRGDVYQLWLFAISSPWWCVRVDTKGILLNFSYVVFCLQRKQRAFRRRHHRRRKMRPPKRRSQRLARSWSFSARKSKSYKAKPLRRYEFDVYTDHCHFNTRKSKSYVTHTRPSITFQSGVNGLIATPIWWWSNIFKITATISHIHISHTSAYTAINKPPLKVGGQRGRHFLIREIQRDIALYSY